MIAVFKEVGLTVNTTPSLAKGIYFKAENQILSYGDIVSFCLPEKMAIEVNAKEYLGHGSCENGLRPLLKFVAGQAGDMVNVEDYGICITPKGKDIACVWGLPKSQDNKGNPIITRIENSVISEGKLIVLTPFEDSFDSRYFGEIEADIVTKVQPFYTFY